MPLSEADLRSTALAVFRAWNDHDVDAVLGYLAGDVLWAVSYTHLTLPTNREV